VRNGAGARRAFAAFKGMTAQDKFGLLGRVIDSKYRVECVVDEGTFGVVYRAHHLTFDEKVAIKCLKLPQQLAGPALEEFCRRFVAEGRFLHRLSRGNVHVVQALDAGTELVAGGSWVPYLVLEWLEGVSLADDLEARARRGRGGRGLAGALALLAPAAEALANAHEQRVAHCDVKPGNLFLADVGGRVALKVLDFGIARFADGHVARELAGVGVEPFRAFSPPYAAPEQFDPSFGRLGPPADVFSLALVLVEVASGRSALEGETVEALFASSSDEARRPTLRARGVACPEAVDAVVRRALAVRPADRFATVGEFWRALTLASGLGPDRGPRRVSPASARERDDLAPAYDVGAIDDGAVAATGRPPASDGGALSAVSSAVRPARPRRALGAAAALAFGAAAAYGVARQSGAHPSTIARSLGAVAGSLPRVDASPLSGPVANELARIGRRAADALAAAADVNAPPRLLPPPAEAPPSPAAAAAANVESELCAASTRLAAPTEAAPTARVTSTAASLSTAPSLSTATDGATGSDGDVRGFADFTLRPLGRALTLDYGAAARACAADGMALCSDAQWQIACDARAPLGRGESWTTPGDASGDPVVRGGDAGCGARRPRAPSLPLRTSGQACCAPTGAGEAGADGRAASPARRADAPF
jgi:serine/threonine-protein kinase